MTEYDDFFSGVSHSPSCVCGFVGDYRWLSNFFPCQVEWGGLTYCSSEAAYQASKFYIEQRDIFTKLSAREAKKLGREIPMTRIAQGLWDCKKERVMRGIVLNTFTPTPELGKKLMVTGSRYLEETNWWGDTVWGVYREVGSNVLGEILMETRTSLLKRSGSTEVPFPTITAIPASEDQQRGFHCSRSSSTS